MSTCTKNGELFRCSRCGEVKPAYFFSQSVKSKTGLQWSCKDCQRSCHKERCRQRAKMYEKVEAALSEVGYEKVCKACRRLMPARMFCRQSANADYLRNICKECISKYMRLKKYNLSEESIKQMLSVETCQMPGCGKKLRNGQGTHIDHCHKTGKVREVLCQKCNLMLGYIEKNLHLVQPMLDYIAKHKDDDESE